MNGVHLHLMVNHVSLFCIVIGVIALAVSMKRKSSELRQFASALLIAAAVFSWAAEETGEQAESVVKTLGGDTENFIHEHEEAAEWAMRSSLLIATLAIAMEWAFRKKPKWSKPLQWAVLLFGIHGFTVFGMTSFQGGKIRHTEVRSEGP